MVILSPKHKTPTRVYNLFTFVRSENVFCQGMVVLLNPVCVLLSGMLHVYKSDVSVAVFETRWFPKHWLRSIENCTVWTFRMCVTTILKEMRGREISNLPG